VVPVFCWCLCLLDSMASSVATRRSSGEVFDPTAYAARRKEKLQAAAALREQRKKDQEKRESDRGTGTTYQAHFMNGQASGNCFQQPAGGASSAAFPHSLS
jgi:hypothetical protein